MEVPIPNFYFMGVQFIHLLALSVWIGGIVSIGMIVAPTLFRNIKSRRTAGELMGEVLRKFDKITIFCIVGLIMTGVIKYWAWENLTPWNLTRYVAILIMSSCGLYSALVVSPKLHRWLTYQASGKEKVALSGASVIPIRTSEKIDPAMLDFNQLHHVSVRLMMVNLVCGVVALLMA